MRSKFELWEGSMLSQADLDKLMNAAAQNWDDKISRGELYDVQEEVERNYTVDKNTLFMDWLALNQPTEVYVFVFDQGKSSEMTRGNTKTLYEILSEFYQRPDEVYDIINFGDSADREYLFTAFEDVFDIRYDNSYNWWLYENPRAGEAIAAKLQVSDSCRVKDAAANNPLISEDGMIYVGIPPTFRKFVPCKPIGEPFYDEDDGGTYLAQFCEYQGHIITALTCVEANEEGGYEPWPEDRIVEGIYDDGYISESMQEEMDKLGIGFDPEGEEVFYWK